MRILGFDPGRDKCGLAVMEKRDKLGDSSYKLYGKDLTVYPSQPSPSLIPRWTEGGKGGPKRGRREQTLNNCLKLLYNEVVISQEVLAQITSLISEFSIDLVVMGDQTTAKIWKKKIENIIPESVAIVMVDERNSSLEARDRYWEMYPPQGLSRLIPLGMRLPPRPVDDIVAILLIERYIAVDS